MTEALSNAQLKDRVVVITGGNGGIGLGMAEGVATAGATAVIWGRNASKSEDAVNRLREQGRSAMAVTCDISSEDSVTSAMQQTIDRMGRLDAFIANAGIPGRSARVTDLSLGEWRQVMSTNIDGTFLCLREAARQLVKNRQGGALVAVTSIVNSFGAPREAAYAVSKAGIGALVRSLAIELAPHGIRCNALSPGWIETDLLRPSSPLVGRDHTRFHAATVERTPVGRWGQPGDLGAAAAFLVDPTARFHTGDVITVDGGYSIF